MARPQIPSLVERLCPDTRYAGRGVCIAFVDAGFFPHADLQLPRGRIRAYVDVTRDKPEPRELLERKAWSWHGTMTTCCAAGNGYLAGGRYRGLASESDVVLIKAKDEDQDVRADHLIAALEVPLRHPDLGIRILSVSIGVDPGDARAADIEQAVERVTTAGVVVVVAAGNVPDRAPTAPASAKSAITVGGFDDHGTLDTSDDGPWPSSHGNGKPDLLAPAAWVPAPMVPGTLEAREAHALYDLLTVLEEMALERGARAESTADLLERTSARIAGQKYIARDYQHVDGTSFAAPIVASIVAQMLEARGTLTPADVREGLLHTARKLDGVSPEIQGAGLVQAAAAVRWAEIFSAGQERTG
ncbi:MAG TPA: S8 family serine peptidase [Polyangiaceae bacterium]|jgi:serine protease AprX